MNIRPERPEEFGQIYELVKTAFQTAPVASGDEQDFVLRLRASEAYIPELALVAEKDGALAGLVMLTRARLAARDGQREVLLLAPLCVEVSRRSAGLGARLVGEAFERARGMGFTAVFLLGDPAYYARFGFRPVGDFGVTNPYEWPAPYFQACELTPGALAWGGEFTCDVPE